MARLQANWLWWLALIAGVSFMIPVIAGGGHTALTIAWKGAGVALLAAWAGANARDGNGMLITLVLAFGALGDVLLDAVSLEVGAVAFVIGHVFAIMLYWRNRRVDMPQSAFIRAFLLVPLAVLICRWMLGHMPGNTGALIYTAIVALMAATALVSRFPRSSVGLGAVLFLISDLVIFGRLGGVIDPRLGTLLIWPLYFAGQALIARGVVTTLRGR